MGNKKEAKGQQDQQGRQPKVKKSKAKSPLGNTPKAPASAQKRNLEGGGEGEAGGSSKKPKPAAPKDEGTPPPMAELSAAASPQSRYQTPADSPEREAEQEPEPSKKAAAKHVQSPSMTLKLIIPGSEIGIDRLMHLVVPAGANLNQKRSWARFVDDNGAMFNRMSAEQLSLVAEHKEITADAPCAAGVPAAIVKMAGRRMRAEMAAAKEAVAAAAQPATAAAVADGGNAGADKAALLANINLLHKIDTDVVNWTELETQFDVMEDKMSVSTTGCTDEQINEILLQAASQALTGSGAEVRATYIKSTKHAGTAPSYEDLRALIIATYRPNDASSIQFQSLVHFGKIAQRFKKSQTLLACFERRYGELFPNGVDTNGKYDHKVNMFTTAILNCFPKLMKRLKGKKPKKYGELVDWFHLQFVGGSIPPGTAAVFHKIDTDVVNWTELETQFDVMEDKMSVSTTGCTDEQINEILLQAASQALTGSGAEVRATYIKSTKHAGTAPSYEDLRALIIATYRPNDASSIQFQSLVHFGKIAQRFKKSQTLLACFERRYGELFPNGVDTNGKYDHKVNMFTTAILNCFPKLMKRLKGKKPKKYGELVDWFHLQFVGGSIPPGTAAVFATHCGDCSGYHPKGRCRVTEEDGARADRTIDDQERRRGHYRRPGGSYTKKQVVAIDARIDQAHQRQEDPAEFDMSIAALAGQFDRQNGQRDASRNGGGRGRERGTFQRGRGRGGRGDRRRERTDDRYDNDVAREVRRQIAALNVRRTDVGFGDGEE